MVQLVLDYVDAIDPRRKTWGGRPCLAEVNPGLARELIDQELAWAVSPGSQKKLEWKCRQCSHQWGARVGCRSQGRGCPKCAGMFSEALAEANPDLASELVNQELAKTVTPGSEKKLEWKCGECLHQWSAAVGSRTQGVGCPKCAGKYSETLAESNPKLASELVNEELAWTVSPGSGKRLEWKCGECFHQWSAAVYRRTQGKGCPKCATSKMNRWSEKVFETLELDFKMEHRFDECRSRKPLPFDAAILQGDQVIALFEFQGRQHFEPVERFGGQDGFARQKKRDEIKRRFAQENGIPLVGELTRLQIIEEVN